MEGNPSTSNNENTRKRTHVRRTKGPKWQSLEHKGPAFPPEYKPLSQALFQYNGRIMQLSPAAEEVAGFYAKSTSEYKKQKRFNDNFFEDWRNEMTEQERKTITDLQQCNFDKMLEENRQLTMKQFKEEYGYCTWDGERQDIGNFYVEPRGLFYGRGKHPKNGKLKMRVLPEDVTINCSEGKEPSAPPGHRWAGIEHNNKVTWLASWKGNVTGKIKYIKLDYASKIKGEEDLQKYNMAHQLHNVIDKIRETYKSEWSSQDETVQQKAIALYFIDRLSLRVGNEKKDIDNTADTVGCCSLQLNHIELHKEKGGRKNIVVLDFLGKDSVKYYNEVTVEESVFKKLDQLKRGKKEGVLFNAVQPKFLNSELEKILPGLTAKVFRTYNASITMQRKLEEFTKEKSEKIVAFYLANHAVAKLCNHKRETSPKNPKSMNKVKNEIERTQNEIDKLKSELNVSTKDVTHVTRAEELKAKQRRDLEKKVKELIKLKLYERDLEEKTWYSLITSKLNYIDPRIVYAWCKKHDVSIEQIYTKRQREKYQWAFVEKYENFGY